MPESYPTLSAICPEPENYSEAGLTAIQKMATLTMARMSPEELVRQIVDFDLLFVRLQTEVTRELLRSACCLRAVVSPTTGLNHIDLEAAAEFGVEVFHLKGETEFLRSVPSTAEHTWALLLSLTRHVSAASRAVLNGRWEQKAFRGRELHGKRLGVLGCGRLGSMVAHYGRAFGMDVSTFDPYADIVPSYVRRCDSLEALLAESDILSIHVPLNQETQGMLGGSELQHLPSGAILINTARGEIVDERALVSALESGHISGAAADVVRHELDQDPSLGPLVTYAKANPNVIITPHIGGATTEAIEKTDLFVIEKLSAWLADTDKTPLSPAPLPRD